MSALPWHLGNRLQVSLRGLSHRIPAWSGLAGPSVGHPAQPPAQAGSPRAGQAAVRTVAVLPGCRRACRATHPREAQASPRGDNLPRAETHADAAASAAAAQAGLLLRTHTATLTCLLLRAPATLFFPFLFPRRRLYQKETGFSERPRGQFAGPFIAESRALISMALHFFFLKALYKAEIFNHRTQTLFFPRTPDAARCGDAPFRSGRQASQGPEQAPDVCGKTKAA